MPWLNWSDAIKKRICRYLLQRYLGQFLQEKLTLDQLSVDLYNGKGRISDVCLDVKGLNELGEKFNLPIRFVEGFILSIEVAIPWTKPLTDNSVVEIDGLMMTVQPKQRVDDASMFEPMWGSMMSSMQLAEEYLRQEPLDKEDARAPAEPLAGLEQFAQAIETVFSRIKVRLTNTVLRVEHFPSPSSQQGVALELHIKSMDYYDQVSTEAGDIAGETIAQRVHERISLSTKRIILNGSSLYAEEFSLAREASSSLLPRSTAGNDGPQELLAGCAGASPPLVAPSQESSAPEPEPILISQLMGQQEIRLQLKQDESLEGPNVDVDFSLGQLPLFLCPRQVHLLIQLAKGFSCPTPASEDLSGSLLSRRYKCKPMESHHFAIAEEDLQRQIINLRGRAPQLPSRSLGGPNAAGWSTCSGGCFSDSDEEYAPMTRQGAFSESGSVASSDMDSSVSSSTYNSFSKPKKRSKGTRRSSQGGGGFAEDALLELTHFRVHCSAVYAVILHDDVAGVANSNRRRFPAAASCPSPKEASMMHAQAETFFRALAGQNLRDLGSMRSLLPKICRSDHIRIAGAPITLEGTEKSSPSQWSLSFQLSVVEMEVIECVFDHCSDPDDESASLRDAEFCELLSFFEKDNKKKRPSEAEPFLRLKCEHVEKTSQGRVREPCTTVVVEMLPAQIEVDRSLEDRIHALLHPPPHLSSATQKENDIWSLSVDQGNRGASLSSSKTSIRVHSSFVKVNLRFPIPDMRPVQELLRERWWEKNLRTNILSVDLSEPTLSTTFTNDRDADLQLVLVCKDAHVFHQESPLSRPVLFARVFVDPKVKEADFDWLRMEVRISPSSQPSPLETVGCGEEDTLLPSMMDTLLLMPAAAGGQDPGSPFAVQHVMYDGNKVSPPRTTRLQEQQQQQQQRGGGGHDGSRTDSSEMIQPGDKASLRSFMEKTANNCRIHLDFSLPSVELTMPDKQFYEVIYNLLTMDLVLWEPVATRVSGCTDVSAMSGSGGGVAFFADLAAHRGQQEFVMCRSGLPADSDEESDGAPSVFYSVYDHQRSTMRHGRSSHQLDSVTSTTMPGACRSLQTQLVIGVHITDGVARLGTPLRDAGGELVPRQQGELRVCAKDAQLFISSSHRGDPNVSYVLFSAGTASLHHRGKAGCSTPLPVLYKSADGVAARLSPFAACEAEPVDMLSLVIETCADPAQGVKTIKVAVGVSGTTLRHRMSPFRHSWVKQFIDFFDVVDEEVRGYTPLGVVTELHLNLTNCAIDYRPLYIPYRSLVSMENFSISSNITAKTTTLQIRVIAEQVCLYISNKVAKDEPPDLANEYVCVADTDLFDLSIWMTEVAGQETPTIKMKASNNIVHVRTCADSCQALQTLLSYFATDGDLIGSPGTPPPGTESAGTVVPEQLNSVTIRMSDHYQSLMAEAMRESSSSTSGSHSPDTDNSPPSFVRADHDDEDDDNNSDEGFRDARCDDAFACNGDDFSVRREVELQCATENDELVTDGGNLLLRMSTTSSSQSAVSSQGTPARESDEEFCILEDDPGVGIVPRSGQPQIRVLVPGPIDVRENYFSSSARNTDQLRAPRHFPEAVQKYTLREMSLVWHLYGGCDFESTSSSTPASGTSKSPPERHPSHWNFDEQLENYANVILEPMVGNAAFSRGSPVAGDSPLPCRQPQSPPATPRHGGGKVFAGGPGRRDDVLMELHMNKIRFQHELFPEGAMQASRQVLLIQDVEIRDRLASSRINKFLYQYTSETMPRQSHANMVMVKLLHIRPDPKLSSQECCMRVTLKPLRLNIDQDALLFLYEFFTSISSNSPTSPSSPPADFPEFARSNVSDDIAATATLSPSPSAAGTSNNQASSGASGARHVAFAGDEVPVSPPPSSTSSSGGPPPLYIRTFAFTSDVPIRIDYHGKRVAMDQGALAGLLMGLGQLNCLEITLKRLYCRQGLLGSEKLVAFVLNEWLNDIKKNQVPSVLGGVGPMHSFVQLFSGLRDLVWMPVEQYRRDGRIVRGLQRGANSFTVSTAMACLELTNKLVQTVQGVAELAYDMLSPGPSLRVEVQRGHHRALPSTQPLDIREGVNNAYHVVAEGLGGTARTLVQAASQEHRQKGVSGAVGGLLRHLGPTMAAGIIVATEATSSVLGGVRNQIRPDARREAVQKWRQPSKTPATLAAAAAALATASR
ncbi:autophagy-related 2 isoform X2 [Haemaphysalis longicornis]